MSHVWRAVGVGRDQKKSYKEIYSVCIFNSHLLYLLGSIDEWGSSISPLIASVSVLLDDLHVAQVPSVRPSSRLQLLVSLLAADPGWALVCCHRLLLSAGDRSPRLSLPTSPRAGGWGGSHFGCQKTQDGWRRHPQWESIKPTEERRRAANQKQANNW